MDIAKQRRDEALSFIQRGNALVQRGYEILNEANLLDRHEGGMDFACAITGLAENTIRVYVTQGKIRTASKAGKRRWFTKKMLLEDMDQNYPNREQREEMKLEGKVI